VPTFRPYRPDGGTYVLLSDRELPADVEYETEEARQAALDALVDQRVTWHHRDPLPFEIAEFEQATGYMDLGNAEMSSEGGSARSVKGRPRWVSRGPTNNVRALLRFLTAVEGQGPDGPLAYPAAGTDEERERFLGIFRQVDLYEVAEHILGDRAHLTEDERGN